MRFKIKMEIELSDEKECRVVYLSIKPEVKSVISKDTSIDMSIRGKRLVIYIRSDSISKLRAAVNSYGRWIALVRDVYRGVKL